MPFLDDLSALVQKAQKEVEDVNVSRGQLADQQKALNEAKATIDNVQKEVDAAATNVQRETSEAIDSLGQIVSRVNEEIAKLQKPSS